MPGYLLVGSILYLQNSWSFRSLENLLVSRLNPHTELIALTLVTQLLG
jgi:hypothetical protein